MAKITAKQAPQDETFQEVVDGAEVAEASKARTQRVKSDVTLKDGIASFVYTVVGLDNEDGTPKPVAASLDLNVLLSVNSFVFKAAIEGIKSKLQTAYSKVTSPVEIEKIISETFSDLVEGTFESRMFSEKKVVIPDVVIAHMRHVGDDLNNPERVQLYINSWNSRSRSEQMIFRNSKAISNQLIAIEQERVAKKAARLQSAELPEVEIVAL